MTDLVPGVTPDWTVDGLFVPNQCAMSFNTARPSWEIDLGADYVISHVVITRSIDSPGEVFRYFFL